jgi:alpha-ketoglutaric semialdehyde dehydrogenase
LLLRKMSKAILVRNILSGCYHTENRSPSDLDDLVGLFAAGTADQTAVAVTAARAALPAWAGGGIQVRADLLDRVGNALAARRTEL